MCEMDPCNNAAHTMHNKTNNLIKTTKEEIMSSTSTPTLEQKPSVFSVPPAPSSANEPKRTETSEKTSSLVQGSLSSSSSSSSSSPSSEPAHATKERRQGSLQKIKQAFHLGRKDKKEGAEAKKNASGAASSPNKEEEEIEVDETVVVDEKDFGSDHDTPPKDPSTLLDSSSKAPAPTDERKGKPPSSSLQAPSKPSVTQSTKKPHDWWSTAFKLTAIVAIIIAAFGALCLAGVFPAAFLGGQIGCIVAITVGGTAAAAAGFGIWWRWN